MARRAAVGAGCERQYQASHARDHPAAKRPEEGEAMSRFPMMSLLLWQLCTFFALAGDRPKADRLAKSVPLDVDGKPLVREERGLFPFVGDFSATAAKPCSWERSRRKDDCSSTATSAPKRPRD